MYVRVSTPLPAEFGDPDVDLQYHCMKAISQKPAQK
jgi:hypothetical protein